MICFNADSDYYGREWVRLCTTEELCKFGSDLECIPDVMNIKHLQVSRKWHNQIKLLVLLPFFNANK